MSECMNNQRRFNNEDISCQLSVAEEQMYHTQQMRAVGDTSESSSRWRPFKNTFGSDIVLFLFFAFFFVVPRSLLHRARTGPRKKKTVEIFGTLQIFEAIWREMTYENYERIVRLQFECT